MKFYVVVYPSEDSSRGSFVAHCLNMDIVADGKSVEHAVSDLLENIEATLHAAKKHRANPFKDAPREYWDKLASAKRLPLELVERIIRDANKRHQPNSEHAIVAAEDCDLRSLVAV